MSDLNIEKDDQATQEMLEMMGELSNDIDNTLHDQEKNPTDDLLNELEGLPELEEKPDPALEKTQEKALETDILKDDEALNVEDIDELMSDMQENTETSIEISTTTDKPENTSFKETEEKEEEEVHINPDENIEQNIVKEKTPDEESQTEMEHADNIADLPQQVAENTIEETAPANLSNENENEDEEKSLITQAQQSIKTMEESIQLDQEIQEIASNIQGSAQEAIQTAIAVSEQAQQSTEQIQQAIEATLNASEQAFEAVKEAGYQIETNPLETVQNAAEMVEQLQKINVKNQQLKEINNNLQQRISELS
ncbi:hypothetical protein MNBD_GAMMA03-1219 [hydrothermal vent metagenome]|uniref:Uncharacterized protein n=1 Tax=hydrothermal vent metagenome TaxID=652676 RepID=A0A3B0VVI2_9ZZZZ